MALGASSIGPRSTTLGDSGPRRNQMAVVFDEGATLVPVAAYVVTRVMPLLNLWSPIHRRPDEVGRHRRVYVVELSDEAGERAHGGCPNLYVGETARTPEDRFQTHLTGGRTASRVVRRHGRWLRPDLYEHIPPVGSKEQSAEVEGWLKQELERLGHRVWGGTRGIHEAPFARAPGPTSNES